MPWQRIPKKDTHLFNNTLKNTDALFTQYPYYVSSEYNSFFSNAVFIKYVEGRHELAFAAIIEIGLFPFKLGVIDGTSAEIVEGDLQPGDRVMVRDQVGP